MTDATNLLRTAEETQTHLARLAPKSVYGSYAHGARRRFSPETKLTYNRNGLYSGRVLVTMGFPEPPAFTP
jgi:hypothetical protein